MRLPVILRPEAEEDIEFAFTYFEGVRIGLGQRFGAKLREALQRLELNPEAFGRIWASVRAVRVAKFRYVIYYVIADDHVDVIAVLHGSRDSFAWRSRI